MTDKQKERLKAKIKKIKSALAADKKHWGGYYHDGGGLRYLPPALYIQLGDYTGGLRYVNWFKKNFPDDIGMPEFLFEWTFILFKTGRHKEAEKKAFETFCGNTYLFDVFFERPVVPVDKWEGSGLEVPEYAKHLGYSHRQPELADFAEWLGELTQSERFAAACDKFIEIQKRLETEEDREERSRLIDQERELLEGFGH